MNSDPTTIRQQMKRARLALTPAEREHANKQLTRNLLALTALHRCTSIGMYLPFRGEADCMKLLASEKLRKKRVFLPVLAKNHLRFAELFSDSDMRPNRYGILEPVHSHSDLVNPTDLNIVLTPLVAFDSKGNRIGMGAGFYDRSFAFRKRRRKWRKPLLIGVAYDFQRVDKIHPAPWDVPLDGVVTDQQYFGSY